MLQECAKFEDILNGGGHVHACSATKASQPGELRLAVSGFFLLGLSPSPAVMTEDRASLAGVDDVTFNRSNHCSVSVLSWEREDGRQLN